MDYTTQCCLIYGCGAQCFANNEYRFTRRGEDFLSKKVAPTAKKQVISVAGLNQF